MRFSFLLTLFVLLGLISCSESSFSGRPNGDKDGNDTAQEQSRAKNSNNENAGKKGSTGSGGGTTDGTSTGGGSVQVSEGEIRAKCQSSAVQKLNRVLTFNPVPRGSCQNWMNPINSSANAFLELRQVVPVPSNALICGINLSSNQTNWRYDDYAMFRINEFVIMTSIDAHMGMFPTKDMLPTVDLSRLRGQIVNASAPSRCIGNSPCSMPIHDTDGAVSIQISDNVMFPMAKYMVGKANIEAALVLMGDNDTSVDCYHTGLDINLEVRYVER